MYQYLPFSSHWEHHLKLQSFTDATEVLAKVSIISAAHLVSSSGGDQVLSNYCSTQIHLCHIPQRLPMEMGKEGNLTYHDSVCHYMGQN